MPEQNNQSFSKTHFLLGFFAGAALISTLGFAMLLNGGNKPADQGKEQKPAAEQAQPTEQPEPSAVQEVAPITDRDHGRGNPQAKVALIVYSDFECPFCARHAETMGEVLKKYQNQVLYAFRHFPLSFHQEAQKAAEAAECAGEQGKFWEMHDLIFSANRSGEMNIAKWIEGAKKLGLKSEQFKSCLESGKYASRVGADLQGGLAAGVEGTPATFINARLISGAVPLEQLEQIIESLLK